MRIGIFLILLFGGVLALLSACLHDPTESDTISSGSKNLRKYQDGDNIVYNVTLTAGHIVEDANLQPQVVLKDGEGNIVNCPRNENWDTYNPEIGGICFQRTRRTVTGSLTQTGITGLVVQWEQVDNFPSATGGDPITVMKETWTLSVPNFPPDNPQPVTYVRYITQTPGGFNGGEVFVHAYDKDPVNSLYYRVSTGTVSDVNQAPAAEGGAKTDASPVAATADTLRISHNMLDNCDAAGNCVHFAKVLDNFTYQLDSEPMQTPWGIYEVYPVDKNGLLRPPVNDVPLNAAPNMAFPFGCNTETTFTDNSTYNVGWSSYSANMSLFPDIGPLRMFITCHFNYELTYKTGGMVNLNGQASRSSAGGADVRYEWQFISQPPGSTAVLFSNVTETQFVPGVGSFDIAGWGPVFQADEVGLYAIRLYVKEGDLNNEVVSTEDIVYIQASELDAEVSTRPIANAGPNQNVPIGATVNLNGTGSREVDASGNTLSYAWNLVSATDTNGAIITPEPTLIGATTATPSFTASVAGIYHIELVVTDPQVKLDDTSPAVALDSIQDAVFITATTSSLPLANAGVSRYVRASTERVAKVDAGNTVSTFVQIDATVRDTSIPRPQN